MGVEAVISAFSQNSCLWRCSQSSREPQHSAREVGRALCETVGKHVRAPRPAQFGDDSC